MQFLQDAGFKRAGHGVGAVRHCWCDRAHREIPRAENNGDTRVPFTMSPVRCADFTRFDFRNATGVHQKKLLVVTATVVQKVTHRLPVIQAFAFYIFLLITVNQLNYIGPI